MSFYSDSLKNIFFVLGNEYRFRIIDALLNKEKLTMTNLASELETEISTIQNYVEYLLQNEVIEKDQKGNFMLTNHTNLLVKQIPYFQFLINNKEFFKEHSFGDLKLHFIDRISELSNSKLIDDGGYTRLQQKLWDMYENCSEYIFNILHEVDYSKDVLDRLHTKFKENDKFITRTVFSESPIIPRKYKEIIKNYNFIDFKLTNQIQQKQIEQVKISVILTEKESILMFPRISKSVADTTEFFYSDDKNFHKWCIDYFNDVWSNASSFDLNNYINNYDNGNSR